MAEIGFYQTSSNLPKIIKQVKVREKARKEVFPFSFQEKGQDTRRRSKLNQDQ